MVTRPALALKATNNPLIISTHLFTEFFSFGFSVSALASRVVNGCCVYIIDLF
jgi:hypothetical protein